MCLCLVCLGKWLCVAEHTHFFMIEIGPDTCIMHTYACMCINHINSTSPVCHAMVVLAVRCYSPNCLVMFVYYSYVHRGYVQNVHAYRTSARSASPLPFVGHCNCVRR